MVERRGRQCPLGRQSARIARREGDRPTREQKHPGRSRVAARRRAGPRDRRRGGARRAGDRHLRRLSDAGPPACRCRGAAGDAGAAAGLDLLPVETLFSKDKEVRQVEASWDDETWPAYEIHMGRTRATTGCDPLLRVRNGDGWHGEGVRSGAVWGTYLHGLFESAAVRRELSQVAGFTAHQPSPIPWRQHLQSIYEGMAGLLEQHLHLEPVWRYVET